MEAALPEVVLKLDFDPSNPLTLTYSGNKLTPGPGWPSPSTPLPPLRDLRGYRKGEKGPCVVFKSLLISSVDNSHSQTFKTKIILPLFFVPYVGIRPRRQYEYLQLGFTPAADPYEKGRCLSVYGCYVNAGAFAPLPATQIIRNCPAAAKTLETVFSTADTNPYLFPFEVSQVGIAFEKDNILSALNFKASNGIVFGYKGPSISLPASMGIDFFARSIARPKDSFISFGVGFGAFTQGAPLEPTVSFDIKASISNVIKVTSFEFPIDDDLRIRMYQSPALADSLSKDKAAEWILEITGLSPKAFVRWWNERVAKPHLLSIDTIDAARGLSLMPVFDEPTIQTNDDRASAQFGFAWRVTQKDRTSTAFDNFSVRDLIGAFAVDPKSSFTVNAEFPKLLGRDGAAFKRSVTVNFTAPTIAKELYGALKENAIPSLQFSLEAGHHADAEPTIVRVGALDLTLDANGPLRGTLILDVQSLITGRRAPHVNIRIEQGLNNVAPGGEDPVPDSQLAEDVVSIYDSAQFIDAITRAAPIVACEGTLSVDDPDSNVLLLDGQEITAAQRSRDMIVRLRAIDRAAAGFPEAFPASFSGSPPSEPAPPSQMRVVIIDPEPFLVAAVDVPALLDAAAFGADSDGEFAIYRLSETQGEGWSLGNVPNGFDLYLPPQGIGEAMEKGAPWPPISPDPQFPIGSPPASPPASPPITIDYRLSPAARLWLADTGRQQRYGEAPWNLRRRFGNPQDTTPGSQFAGMRAEFLYGLAMQMRSDFLRIAELGARIGALQSNLPAGEGLPPDSNTPAGMRRGIYDSYRTLWAQIGKAYNTRLAYLEPWREGTSGALVFDERSASFLLRTELQNPPEGYEAADMRMPLVTSDSSQLAGGATWAFESANIYNETIKNPHSTGGSINAPAFSALGGFGKFMAEFAHGNTRIGAEVTLGRTHRYVVERLGRIGMGWNHAKYVIVYERTTLPSRQFSGKGFPLHEGRPVLRIVEEYIELKQPVRTFADADSPPIRRGPVEACVFNSIKIPVDGRNWGRDIPEGWIIPLWRADADQSIYPKPSIGIRLTATANAAEQSLLANVTEPDRLFFFTSTRDEDGPNTDLWAPVLNVDFVNAPRPAGLGASATNSDDLDDVLADDAMEDPAFAAVTIPIDTGGRHVRLSAGRIAADGLGAELHNITLMRAAPALAPLAQTLSPKATLPLSTSSSGSAQNVYDLQTQVAAVPRALAAGKALLAALPANFAAIAQDSLKSLVSHPVASWKQQLKLAIAGAAERAANQIDGLVAIAQKILNNAENSPSAWVATGTQACTAEANRLTDRIEAAANQLNQTISASITPILNDVQAAQNNWDKQRDRIERSIETKLILVQSSVHSIWPDYDAAFALVGSATNGQLQITQTALVDNINSDAARLTNAVNAVEDSINLTAGLSFINDITQSGNTVIDRASKFLASVPKQTRAKVGGVETF
jgi:hypothetical protein